MSNVKKTYNLNTNKHLPFAGHSSSLDPASQRKFLLISPNLFPCLLRSPQNPDPKESLFFWLAPSWCHKNDMGPLKSPQLRAYKQITCLWCSCWRRTNCSCAWRYGWHIVSEETIQWWPLESFVTTWWLSVHYFVHSTLSKPWRYERWNGGKPARMMIGSVWIVGTPQSI